MIQLLVHAGAPSARKDDDRYSAQAQAYATFAGRRVDGREATNEADILILPSHTDEAEMGQTHDLEHEPTTFLDDTQMAYNALDSQLITSSLRFLEARHSPVESTCSISTDRGLHQNDEPVYHGVERTTPPSQSKYGPSQHTPILFNESSSSQQQQQHSHSSYLRTPVLHRTKGKRRWSDSRDHRNATPKRIRSTFPLPAHHSPSAPPTESWSIPEIRDIQRVSGTQNADPVDPNAVDEITSELPTSYSLSDITTDSDRAKGAESVSQHLLNDIDGDLRHLDACQSLNVLTTTENGRSRVLRPHDQAVSGNVENNSVNTQQEVEFPDFEAENIDIQRCDRNGSSTLAAEKENRGPLDNNVTRPDRELSGPLGDSSELEHSLATLSRFVQPPEPETGLNQFTTHVTDSLRYLVERLMVDKHYKPEFITRSIERLERGHWLLDCSSLNLRLQVEIWQFIEKTIKSGNAGWAVWCSRGDDYDSLAPTAPSTFTCSRTIGPVKVFCWGEVVKHIYLMLYVASKAQVRKLGLQWIDAEGKIVIQMKKA